jgi:DNA-binding response OmpR family regulator
VDVHVGRRRATRGAAGRQIETVIGMGYRFVEEPDAAPPID